MAQTASIVNVRVDENVKRDIEKLYDSLGMNISTAVNMFFKQCLMEQGLPFQPKIKYTVSLKEALREAQEQAVINGTSEMTLDEINEIIGECRQEMREER